jgi:tetratricopeptide (TPR) repeat protein
MAESVKASDHGIAQNIKGIRLTEKGDFLSAIALFNEILAEEPALSGVLFNRAEAKRSMGDLDGAEVDLKLALTISPVEPDYLHALGMVAYEKDDFDTALQWYEKALEQDPNHGTVWNDKGIIAFRRGNYAEARRSFEKAVLLQPDSYDTWFNLADTYDELGLRRERIAALDQLKRLRPDAGEED